MLYTKKTFTVPAAPKQIQACEACVYGRGEHSPDCTHDAYLRNYNRLFVQAMQGSKILDQLK